MLRIVIFWRRFLVELLLSFKRKESPPASSHSQAVQKGLYVSSQVSWQDHQYDCPQPQQSRRRPIWPLRSPYISCPCKRFDREAKVSDLAPPSRSFGSWNFTSPWMPGHGCRETRYYDNVSLLSLSHGQTLELAEMSPAEQQAKKEKHRNFQQFDEMLLTHGFATLFAVTSPWVCTATLLAVIVEIWIDMKSLLDSRQRPFPERARNNEPWGVAFDVYGVLGALTNVLLLIYTSTQYSGWSATEKMVFFVFLEHVIFGAKFMMTLVFPEVPQAVEVLALKQDNVVHRCLEGIKVESQMDFSLFRESRAQEEVQVFGHDLLEKEEGDLQLSLQDSGKSMYQGVIDEVGTLRVNIGMPVMPVGTQ